MFDLNTTHRYMFLRFVLMCFRCVRNTEQVCAIGNVSDLCSGGVQLESLCASSPLCDIQLVWQYMCVALTVKHNYFIG